MANQPWIPTMEGVPELPPWHLCYDKGSPELPSHRSWAGIAIHPAVYLGVPNGPPGASHSPHRPGLNSIWRFSKWGPPGGSHRCPLLAPTPQKDIEELEGGNKDD